jgi:hypothetical protein
MTILDRKQVLGRLLDDVELMRSELGPPDHVFATGDYARTQQVQERWIGESDV